MYNESYHTWYPSSEYTNAPPEDLFFAPIVQLRDVPPLEEFDDDVVEVNKELDLDMHFKRFDDIFSNFRDTIPAVCTPSTFTYSTDSGDEITSTQYFHNIPASEYSSIAEIEDRGSHYGTHASNHSVEFPNGLPLDPTNAAQSDYGVSDLGQDFIDMTLNDLPAMQPSTLPDHVTLNSKVETPPARDKPFKCPYCHFSSARKHNLKTHMGTHDKENSKRFGCITCLHRFSRKHDLRRHRATVHGEQMTPSPSSSMSSISKRSKRSKRCFDTRPDSHRRIATSGDPVMLTSSSYPGPLDAFLEFGPVTDMPENVLAWLQPEGV